MYLRELNMYSVVANERPVWTSHCLSRALRSAEKPLAVFSILYLSSYYCPKADRRSHLQCKDTKFRTIVINVIEGFCLFQAIPELLCRLACGVVRHVSLSILNILRTYIHVAKAQTPAHKKGTDHPTV